jgi:hypothetical protein
MTIQRQSIVDAIDARLKTILVAGGYNLDLGKNVFPWRVNPLGEDDLNGLVYRDMDEGGYVAVGQWQHELTVEIDIHIKHATDSRTQMRKAISDVLAAIGTDVTFGGLAEDVRPAGQDYIRITANDGSYMSAMLVFVVLYVSDPWKT